MNQLKAWRFSYWAFMRHGNCWRVFELPRMHEYYSGNSRTFSWWRFSVTRTGVAAVREAAGESDAPHNTFGAHTTQERSSNQHTATNATPCAAPTLSGVKGSAGVCTTGGAMPSRAAGQSFAGVSSSPAFGETAGSGYGVLGAGNLDEYEREQLSAARIISPAARGADWRAA